MVFILFFLSISLLKADTLIVAYNPSPPFVMDSNDGLEGTSVWLWNQVAETTEHHFEFRKYSLDSLLRAIELGEADLSLNPITINSKRIGDMDFTVPFYLAHSGVMTRNESALTKFVSMIGSFVSLNFVRALFGLGVVIAIFGVLVWFFERKGNEEEFGGGVKGLWNGFWWSAVTMTTVGYGDKSPKTMGGRLVALVWMFTAIIVISGFTASIASSLTVSQITSDVKSIEDLKGRRITTLENSATDLWLKNQYFRDRGKEQSLDACISDLREEKVDYVLYDRPILTYVNSSILDNEFSLIDIDFNPQYYAFPLNKGINNQILEHLNKSILSITEGQEWQHQLNLVGL